MGRAYDYIVTIDAPPASTPCECGGCDWRGPFSALAGIEECTLNPGDPSPAGRCPDPDCASLAYLIPEGSDRYPADYVPEIVTTDA